MLQYYISHIFVADQKNRFTKSALNIFNESILEEYLNCSLFYWIRFPASGDHWLPSVYCCGGEGGSSGKYLENIL